jgi:hypothetical protein
LPDSSGASEDRRAALVSGGFVWSSRFAQERSSILLAEVFNMFVENAVEKGRSIFVSDSPKRRFNTLH